VVKSDHKAVVAYDGEQRTSINTKKVKLTLRKRSPAQHAVFLSHISGLNIEIADSDYMQANFDQLQCTFGAIGTILSHTKNHCDVIISAAQVLNDHFAAISIDLSYQQLNSLNPRQPATRSRTALMKCKSSASWTIYAIRPRALMDFLPGFYALKPQLLQLP
jgi:hypothetical protein